MPTYGDKRRAQKEPCQAATTGALAANTRSENTLIADANGALGTIDSVTLSTIDGINSLLVKDEAAGADNGIYSITDLGSAGTKWRMTRRDDLAFDSMARGGVTTYVTAGTANGKKLFALDAAGNVALNTDTQTWIATPALS